MISNIILILGIILIILGYLYLIILYVVNKNKKLDITAADQVENLLKGNDSINVIESKDNIFSSYNLKRRIVKLTTRMYESNSLFSVSVASLLSGYSLVNNKLINYFSYVFREIKYFSYTGIITIIFSFMVSNIGDSKLLIVIFFLIAIYQYLINSFNSEVMENIEVDKDINRVINNISRVNTIFFIGTLLEMLRLVVIIFNIN